MTKKLPDQETLKQNYPQYQVVLESYLKDWTRVAVKRVWDAGKTPEVIASLGGSRLTLHAHDLMDILKADLPLDRVKPTTERTTQTWNVREPVYIRAALFCGALVCVPPKDGEAMRQVVRGLREMTELETAHWLGMALYRYKKHRVFRALSILLTE